MEKYQNSVKVLQNFADYHAYIVNINHFYWEIKGIYLSITRELGTPNFWNRREVMAFLISDVLENHKYLY